MPGLGAAYVCAEDRHTVLTVVAGLGLAAGALLAGFGVPPLSLHFPTHELGLMSPTCGMTRGVAALLRGDVRAAWAYNPASLAVVAGAVLALARSAVGAVTGRWITVTVDPTRGGWAAAALVLIALWANQQANVELLVSR